jgi:hypothetical protein
MKCPFRKQDDGVSKLREEFRECLKGDCMAYNDDKRICNLCSDKRVFKIEQGVNK